MKTFKEIQVWKQEVSDVICNKCGESCTKVQVENGNFLSINFRAGYGADYQAKGLSDGDDFAFDLCYPCIKEFMNTFKIHPIATNVFENRDHVIKFPIE